jgi:hypothetical protein
MRGSMLTEDIDSSMRTVERGLKIRSDRDVVSCELATTTFPQVWNQRLRWAQGWFQVTMMHTLRVWKSPGLTFRQKFGASYLLGYREVYPWLSLQIFPLVAYWLTRGDSLSYGWPVFFCTTLFVLHIGPVQTWYAYRLADQEIKQHRSWFWAYLFFSTIFYTEYKNTIARVAHIKEFVGERAWKVTPRSDAPVEFEDAVDDADDDIGDDDLEDDDVEPTRVPVTAGMAGSTGFQPVATPATPFGLPSRRPGVSDDPPMPSRREPAEVRADGLPQRTRLGAADRRAPSPTDGRIGPLGGRALPAWSPEGAIAGNTSDDTLVNGAVVSGAVESGRLARRAVGLVPTVGVAGEPLLARRSQPARRPRPARLDETLISARVRELVERPVTPRAPVGEPLLGCGAGPADRR